MAIYDVSDKQCCLVCQVCCIGMQTNSMYSSGLSSIKALTSVCLTMHTVCRACRPLWDQQSRRAQRQQSSSQQNTTFGQQATSPAGVVPLASEVITPDMEGWVPSASATTDTEAEPDHLPSDLSREPSAAAPWSAEQPPAPRQSSCTDLLLTSVRCQHT